jgi:hypothetical protein
MNRQVSTASVEILAYGLSGRSEKSPESDAILAYGWLS